jgi:hypothetical protein
MSRSPFGSPWGAQRSGAFDFSETGSPAIARFFNAVYAWMCVGLAVTALVGWGIISQGPHALASAASWMWPAFIAEIALVFIIGYAVNKIDATVATLLFIVYSALNGVTLSLLFYVATRQALASAFVVTAGTFGAMSVFGMVTKRDLSYMGRLLWMALIGLIIAVVVSIFYHPTGMVVAINFIGVLIFVGLTAFDTQRLKLIALQTEGNPALAARMAIVGSLILYLDFINLFIFLVQIFGGNRKS